MFTRRHYKAIAEIISKSKITKEGRVYSICDGTYIIDQLCNLFANDNSRFDREKFIYACTLEAQ